MALFTKILILAVCAIAVECTFPMGGMGMGMRYPMMGGMMYPGMMYPGMMYPGMMGYKEGEESSANPSESSTPLTISGSLSLDSGRDDNLPSDDFKTFEIRRDQPEPEYHPKFGGRSI